MPNSASAAALARSQARTILAERRFHSAPVPRPLHGVLHAVGRALEAPLNGVDELVSKLAMHIPGGASVVWATLAAVVLVSSAVLAVRGSRRALRDVQAVGTRAGSAPPLRARDLEREADAAERAGLHANAVRLRFRAGLMRLAESERVQGAPSMLNAELSSALCSPRFDALARSFEEIAYGGRAAIEQDAQDARGEWDRLLSSGESG
jgi:hypothetical protein